MSVLRLCRVGPAVLAPALALFTGCSGPAPDAYEPAAPVETSQFKVAGKVTYKGQPVPFGYVLFYPQSGIDPKTGQSAPPVVGQLGPDGRYEIAFAPIGPASVCVATDPDANVASFYQAASLVPGMGRPPALGEAPPDPAGEPPPGGPPGVPPAVGAPPGLPGAPTTGPPDAKGPPAPPALPPGVKRPPAPPTSAEAEKLTAEQKKMLKELHAKYGTFGRSPLAFVVSGQADEVFDIELK